jgi:hypothetical protein
MKRSPRSYPQFSFRAGSVSDGGNACLIVYLDFRLRENDGRSGVHTLHHRHPRPLTFVTSFEKKAQSVGAMLHIHRPKISPSGVLFKYQSSKQ